MVSGFRFDPPLVELGAELAWVLARAFGPADGLGFSEVSLGSERIIELADALSLAPRIGARIPLNQLETEAGADVAGHFREAHTSCVARSLVVEQVYGEIGGLGAELGITTVFLKGSALQIGGCTAPGSRDMCDVDVLVPAADARRLQEALVASGCRVTEAPEAEHQLEFLTHRTGLGIEVHRLIPGLRLEGGRFVDLEALVAGDLLEPAPGMPGDSLVPRRELMFAHVLVHGIAQHGLAPDAYPFSRVLADVQDLGLSRDEFDAFMANGFRWIESDVARAEVEAVFELGSLLGTGKDPVEIAKGEEPNSGLLRHIIVGATDDQYALSMRLARRSSGLSSGPRRRRLFRDAWRTVWLTRGQVKILYGTPSSALGYWGWRLWRPFDLVVRACRYGWAWAAFNLRKR